jgi:hypothetical protein
VAQTTCRDIHIRPGRPAGGADRVRTLREARRVVRPGGPVFVAAISRWAPRLDGGLTLRLYESRPELRELVNEVERSGWMPPLASDSFSAYCHRPGHPRLSGRIRCPLSGRALSMDPWRQRRRPAVSGGSRP